MDGNLELAYLVLCSFVLIPAFTMVIWTVVILPRVIEESKL